MALKKLAQASGSIFAQPNPGDGVDQIVREAILVHAGPESTPIQFQSGDGPIGFDEARIKRVVAVHNAMMEKLAADYGGADKMPFGAYLPLLDGHESGSNDKVIGRLTGRLVFEIRDVPKVGKNVPCAVARPGITFLGKGTVEQVNDGRIYPLSIGISETDDSLGELSTVVQPAAPGAMLLRQGQGGQTTSDGGKTTMAFDIKRLKAHQARMTRLSAITGVLTETKTNLVATSEVVKLAQRKSNVTHRLTAIIRAGKLTPAEYRNVIKDDGLTKLAKLDDGSLGVALSAFESREKPVIEPGQRGSTAAVDFATLADGMGKREIKNLRSEFAADFKRMTGKKLKGEEEDGKKMGGGNDLEPVNPGKDPHDVPGQAGDEKQLAAHHLALKQALEAGDLPKAKEHHDKIMAHMAHYGMKHMSEYTGDVKSEDEKKGMDDLQKQVDELNTQLARVHGMVEELVGVEKEEGHDLESEGGVVPPKKEPVPPAAAAS